MWERCILFARAEWTKYPRLQGPVIPWPLLVVPCKRWPDRELFFLVTIAVAQAPTVVRAMMRFLQLFLVEWARDGLILLCIVSVLPGEALGVKAHRPWRVLEQHRVPTPAENGGYNGRSFAGSVDLKSDPIR